MSAIVIGVAPWTEDRTRPSEAWMPLSVRHAVAKELNTLWAEFVTDMHDGPTCGPEVARKFWKYVLAGG